MHADHVLAATLYVVIIRCAPAHSSHYRLLVTWGAGKVKLNCVFPGRAKIGWLIQRELRDVLKAKQARKLNSKKPVLANRPC